MVQTDPIRLSSHKAEVLRRVLNQYAIKPALLEVNALSGFTVTIVPEKMGWRATGVLIGWGLKDIEGKRPPMPSCFVPVLGA
jgi:hypothetical protein